MEPEPAPEPLPGFTLEFESAAALRRLVARDAVGLYAIDDGKALRMSVTGSRVGFWPASLPGAFHEMDAATVPAEVVDALLRVQGRDARPTWGVTLPADMQRQLDTLLRNNDRGALRIAASGRITLAR